MPDYSETFKSVIRKKKKMLLQSETEAFAVLAQAEVCLHE
jgi:hypothetical protein